jgi:hypothetical protein
VDLASRTIVHLLLVVYGEREKERIFMVYEFNMKEIFDLLR